MTGPVRLFPRPRYHSGGGPPSPATCPNPRLMVTRWIRQREENDIGGSRLSEPFIEGSPSGPRGLF